MAFFSNENGEGRTNRPKEEDLKPRRAVLEPIASRESVLKVSSIDYLRKENRLAHHTEQFEQDWNILRRGQEFRVLITFDRNINVKKDDVILQFTYGEKAQESKGTVIRIPLEFEKSSRDQMKTWTANAKITGSGNQLTCAVTSTPDCSIGKYKVFIETKFHNDKGKERHLDTSELIILLNPWNKDDTVYMENEEELTEYVLNESGLIWNGESSDLGSRHWDFGQFKSPALEIALRLLENAQLSDVAMTSPVSITRCLSAWVNSSDDNGILEGNWSGDYPEDTTNPCEWTGSIPILKEYFSSKTRVRYGQCWVFSAVATTLCRCLGIPTRSVTNFDSAHDQDRSMTIDYHIDEEGEPLKMLNDSIWNFHVWNESWFRRLDLPDGYDGWQVLDATPQESSEGIMRCGPAPVRAVKEGHVYLNYDVGFVFAEVNGDEVIWKFTEDNTMVVTDIYKYYVGKCISTKRVGKNEREDITENYKYKDGSDEERKVVQSVHRYSTRRWHNIYNLDMPKQLEFEIKSPESTMIGDQFDVIVTVRNKSENTQPVRITMSLINAYYTGVVGRRVKVEHKEGEIKGQSMMKCIMTVSSNEYRERMNPEGRFQFFVTGTNRENKAMSTAQKTFLLKKPELVIEAPKTAYLETETSVTVIFKNRTSFSLEQGRIALEGSGLMSHTVRKVGTIAPGREVKEKFDFKPVSPFYMKAFRMKTMIATFTSKRLEGVETSAEIEVLEKPE